MDEQTIISVNHVSKDFILPHEKSDTIKGLFTNSVKKKYGRKTKEKQHALKDISFEVKKGEFFGIVGRNGSGKSTLLKILAGIYQPNKGRVNTRGKTVPFIELGVGFNPELSGRDNVYLNGALFGFNKKEVDAMYDDIVAFAELERFMDQKLKNYSSGMQVRLAFSLAIKAEADILLIDEVLAVGDTAFQQKCLSYFHELKRNKKTVIFVSHNMEAVEQFCDRAIVINDSKLVFEGSSHEAANRYRKMFAEQLTSKEGSLRDGAQRWGDQEVEFKNYKVTQDKNKVTIKTEVAYKNSLENVVCGFSITGNAHFIVGTNTLIEELNLQKYENASKKFSLTWEIPNIFADGVYLVSLGINSPSQGLTHDWLDEVMQFTVLKEKTTNHIVEPPIKVTVETK